MRTYVFLLIGLLYASSVQADLGGCLVYHANFVLKNGQSVDAFLPLSGYDDYAYLNETTKFNPYCSDKAFHELINRVFWKERKKLKFHVYNHIYLVKPSQTRDTNGQTLNYQIAFADSGSMVQIHLDSIKYTVFRGAKNAEWNFPVTGIELVDTPTCSMMRKKTLVNFSSLSHDPNYDLYYVALNFNQALSTIDLERELESVKAEFYKYEILLVDEQDQLRRQQLYEKQKATRDKIIRRFWKKGIVLVLIQSTC